MYDGQHAFIGMGFAERSDAFDLSFAVRDFFKKEKNAEKTDEPYVPSTTWAGSRKARPSS
eukprot:m.248120 g.248120  ORF g.248120 m.248120 type:complete len:60 (-) comp22607_c10_seq15:286-465(-)